MNFSSLDSSVHREGNVDKNGIFGNISTKHTFLKLGTVVESEI